MCTFDQYNAMSMLQIVTGKHLVPHVNTNPSQQCTQLKSPPAFPRSHKQCSLVWIGVCVWGLFSVHFSILKFQRQISSYHSHSSALANVFYQSVHALLRVPLRGKYLPCLALRLCSVCYLKVIVPLNCSWKYEQVPVCVYFFKNQSTCECVRV